MHMKKSTAALALAGLWLCASVPQAAQAPAQQAARAAQAPTAPKTAPATHVTKDDIQKFFAQMAPNRILDSPIRAVDVGGYRVGVFAVTRPKDSPQDAIYHDTNMTEILYMLEGSADLITGGTIPDARPPRRPTASSPRAQSACCAVKSPRSRPRRRQSRRARECCG